ncbi:MAG TPA: GAF domain-containing protein [Actinomycetota bacterium]|nr:GAF domain-containing protein [Actinomycetota bacterium]
MTPGKEHPSVETLRERQHLLERLTKIQRSVSHRAPLQEVMDAITQGAAELLGDEIAGIRLIDPEDPDYVELVSVVGVTQEQYKSLRRGPVGEGAGGRAIAENRLVIINDYHSAPSGIPTLAADRLQSAMAAPVREGGRVVGSLVVATYTPGRTYSAEEQEALLSLAEHASVALTDARSVEAMREAQHAKDMFLAMVSHELKTPLTVIMGTLKTLQKHAATLTSDLRDEMLTSAFERGRELERLIDRLLQGSRAELAGFKQHLFLPDLIAESARGFEHMSRVKIADIPEAFVYTDAVAVQKIVGILLENAVSHSPKESEIVLAGELVDGEVSLSVTNVGSLPEGLDHATLFLPFNRGPEARSTGVGLGLYIASRLALSTEGKLSASSGPGTVSFTLTIPLPEAEKRPAIRPEEQAETSDQDTRQI